MYGVSSACIRGNISFLGANCELGALAVDPGTGCLTFGDSECGKKEWAEESVNRIVSEICLLQPFCGPHWRVFPVVILVFGPSMFQKCGQEVGQNGPFKKHEKWHFLT